MSADAQPVDLKSLGANDDGTSTEAIFYETGEVTIQNADSDAVTLDREQVQKLVAFLVNHMAVDA